jgi:phosphatidylglycerophosphate synthase
MKAEMSSSLMPMYSQLQDWFSASPPGASPASRLVKLVVPNVLSLLRIGLALAFPFFPTTWRAGTIVAAALTDLFDGRLSRALHGTSTFGQMIDPVADKLFVGMVLLTMVMAGELSLAELALVGFRDLAVLAGSAWSAFRLGWGSLRQMPPSILGKLTTGGQFGLLMLVAAGVDRSGMFLRLIEGLTMILSLAAGIDYLVRKSTTTGDHETPELQHP